MDLPEWYKDIETRKKVLNRTSLLCAEKILPIFEKKYYRDPRPRVAIEESKKSGKEDFKFNYIATAYSYIDIDFHEIIGYVNNYYTSDNINNIYTGPKIRINITKLMEQAVKEITKVSS